MKILTFDIEDWYNCDFNLNQNKWKNFEVRIYRGVDTILENLNIANTKATFFCLGWIAVNHPNIIKKIHEQGHHIACHSFGHDLIYNLSISDFKKDTEKAKRSIEDITGTAVTAYRAPGFSIRKNTSWAFEVLSELDFEIDCSVFSANHDYGGYPTLECFEPSILLLKNGQSLKEFPLNATSFLRNKIVYSGGGFFRILPYSLIKKLSKNTNYLMTYFHPRDFDYEQPMMPNLSFYRKFKSYVGLKNSLNKFKSYINDFDFIDLESADNKIDWLNARIIKTF